MPIPYLAMSRGEDAPVLDVTRAPINGAAQKAVASYQAGECPSLPLHTHPDSRVSFGTSPNVPVAAPPIEPEFKRGDRVMFEEWGGVPHPAEFISDEGAAYILESLATHWWKRYEKANTTELRHATPEELARYWPESVAQVSNLEDGALVKTDSQESPAVEREAPVAADQWIEWKGGECPVSPQTKVDVLYRDGDEWSGFAKWLVWRHGGLIDTNAHIIAYRVAQ